METQIDEIADGIYRLSTYVTDVAPPKGFTYNQFLIKGEAPMLFHLGHRKMFPSISEAVAKVLPLATLRWLGFSHVEADECGALGEWLAAAPGATVAHTTIGCRIWVGDATDRAPRALSDNEVTDLGGKRVRHLATPHLPHGWDAGLLYEETTGTLFCSDILAHFGKVSAVTGSDIVTPAIDGENRTRAISVTPGTVPALRRLAELRPKTLALMHGASFTGDTVAALGAFADHFDGQLRAAG